MPPNSAQALPGGDAPEGMPQQVERRLVAAREGGEIALSYFRKDPRRWTKENDSPVSEADLAVDRHLAQALKAARPDYGWLSEETAETVRADDAGRTFVVDPIDGTRAFIEGRKSWCVSVAIVEQGRPVAGVLDCPALSEIYSAASGQGAWMDGVALRVGPPSTPARLAGPRNLIDSLKPPAIDIRQMPYVPSLAYRIAMIAGRALDATFVRPNANDWDLAAADLILEEAGGQLLTFDGQVPRYLREDPRHGALLAGSGGLLSELAAAAAKTGY